MTDPTPDRLRDDVAAAAQVVAPSWPLSSVIAVNPLGGLEDLPFELALQRAEAIFGARGLLSLDEYRASFDRGRIDGQALADAIERRPELEGGELGGPQREVPPERTLLTAAEQWDRLFGTRFRPVIDEELTDWCARWSVGGGGGDLWEAWRDDHPSRSEGFPATADDALRVALERLRVPEHHQRSYLTAQVGALPGWVSHLRWRELADGTDAVLGFLAAAVVTEAAVLDGEAWFTSDGPRPRPATAIDPRPLLWHEAYERTAHDRLLRAIGSAPPSSPVAAATSTAPAAQVVFCIDVRSEGLRRNLEQQGDYETFGYAGFFGLAAHLVPSTGHGGTDQFPVLLSAATTVSERGDDATARRAAALDGAWGAAEHDLVAPLALAEAAGWAAGPIAALRTVAPGLAARLADRLPASRLDRGAASFDRSQIPVADQAAIVGRLLDLGIGAAPAPLVVLCGHTARADNNPMESGLACGACGGHSGAPNARIVAAMANDPVVRDELARLGTPVPPGTWFVGAEHETVTDVVRTFGGDQVPATHRDALAQLEAALERAGEASVRERARTLPDRPRSVAAVRRRGRDWAEPLPELGLAGNLAFVVGPRSITQHVDLRRRAFLHSYDSSADPDGTTLAGILTAPLVVAQWINAQYFFSTTDPEVFGSGSKAVHNVVGDVGVLSGPGGDLRRGLPLQSVRAGADLLHEPVRLLAVVQGRLDHVDAAIAGSDRLERLVGNGWLHLVARPDEASPWSTRTADGWIERALIGEEAAWQATA